jgi:hypothetical protein
MAALENDPRKILGKTPLAAFVHYQTNGRLAMPETIDTIALIWVAVIIAYGAIAVALLPVLSMVRQFTGQRVPK